MVKILPFFVAFLEYMNSNVISMLPIYIGGVWFDMVLMLWFLLDILFSWKHKFTFIDQNSFHSLLFSNWSISKKEKKNLSENFNFEGSYQIRTKCYQQIKTFQINTVAAHFIAALC